MNKIFAFTLGLALSASVAVFGASVGGNTGGVQYVQGFSGMTPVATSGTPPTGSSSTQVQGTAASGAATVGNPVMIGGKDGSGNVQFFASNLLGEQTIALRALNGARGDGVSNSNAAQLPNTSGQEVFVDVFPSVFNGTTWDRVRGDTTGTYVASSAVALADGANNTLAFPFNGGTVRQHVFPMVFNGTTWDRPRTASVGSNVAATGIAATAPYGQYTGNATQPALSTGNYGAAQLDPAGNLRTAPQRPTASDIVAGSIEVASGAGPTTIITISAGRTWVGTVCATITNSKAAAATGNGQSKATVATAGTGVVPAAGTYFEVNAFSGANAATGTAGTQAANFGCIPMTVVAPAGNSVTLTGTNTGANITDGNSAFSAFGTMQ